MRRSSMNDGTSIVVVSMFPLLWIFSFWAGNDPPSAFVSMSSVWCGGHGFIRAGWHESIAVEGFGRQAAIRGERTTGLGIHHRVAAGLDGAGVDRKSTRLKSSH